MNYLVDTSVALWAVTEDRRLSRRARKILSSSASSLYFSSASVWEIAIKYFSGDLPLHSKPEVFIPEMLRAMRSFLKENDMMAYLTMMTVRLLELHRVLKPTGSPALCKKALSVFAVMPRMRLTTVSRY